jgi:peptidyl-prolyl cis-trans isomerase C
MKTKAMKSLILAAIFLTLTASNNVWAQTSKSAAATTTPSGTVFVVNGATITEKDIDKALLALQGQGKTATPQMREQMGAELLIRHLLVEEAKLQKIDASSAFVERIEDLRQRLLSELLINDYLAKNPITDVDEKAEYDRQKKVLGDGDTTPQYQLRQVLVKTEQEARELIARAKKGEAFDKLAAVSIDENGRANGGLVGWVFPSDLFATLSAVVVNLQKGAVAAAPIQSNAGWHVVKLDDIRPYKIPGFEESRQQIKQALLAQRRQALIDSLMKKAVIKRP